MKDIQYNKKAFEMLASSFLFEGIDTLTVSSLLDGGAYSRSYDAGEIIYEPDSFERALGVIISGCARVTTEKSDKPVFLRKLEKGGVFGAASLFGGENYVSRITAVSETEAAFISQTRVREIITGSGRAAENYIAFLSDRIRYLNSKIVAFTAGDAESRVFRYLYTLEADENGCVTIPASLSLLAGALDISRASLYRAFDGLQAAGKIKRDGKKVILY